VRVTFQAVFSRGASNPGPAWPTEIPGDLYRALRTLALRVRHKFQADCTGRFEPEPCVANIISRRPLQARFEPWPCVANVNSRPRLKVRTLVCVCLSLFDLFCLVCCWFGWLVVVFGCMPYWFLVFLSKNIVMCVWFGVLVSVLFVLW